MKGVGLVAATVFLLASVSIQAKDCDHEERRSHQIVKVRGDFVDEKLMLLPGQKVFMQYHKQLRAETFVVYLNNRNVSELFDPASSTYGEAVLLPLEAGDNTLDVLGVLDLPNDACQENQFHQQTIVVREKALPSHIIAVDVDRAIDNVQMERMLENAPISSRKQ